MTPERKALAESITKYAFALQQVEQAEDVLQKANNRLCVLFAESAELSEHDAVIEAKRVEGFKMALINDEPVLMQEPPGYASIHLRKERCASEIQATKEGIKVLEAELDAAKENAEELNIAIENAAEAVIAKEAEQMAISFMARLEELRREQYVMAALMNRWIPRTRDNAVVGISNEPVRGVRQVKFPAIVGVATSQPILGDSELKGGIRVRNAVTAAVNNYWQKLKEDAEAQFSGEDSTNVNLPSPSDSNIIIVDAAE